MLLMKKDWPGPEYDVVVIGSGLGGLTCANILAKHGKKVLLLESHNKLGGLATWFYRKGGHTFDISLHGFPAGMIKTCKKYWNQDIANQIVQLKRIRFINPQFDLETTFTKEDFTRLLEEKFHIPKSTTEAFFQHVSSMNFYDDQKLTTRELFDRYFPGRNDVVRLLMEPITYANGSTLDDPAITYGIVFSNFMSKGVYTFDQGTDHLIQKMKEELLKNGVDIKMHAKVEKVVVEEGVVQGIFLKDQFIKAPCVVSNANILSTIFHLVGAKHFSSDFVAQAQDVRLNSSSCQVYMGIRAGEEIPDVGDLLFTSTAPTFDVDLLLGKKITSRTFSLYYPHMRPECNRYAIVSSTNARYEDWKHLKEQSSEAYEQAKNEMIEDTLVALEKILPGVREKIDFIQAATPLTVERYTLHPQGTSFGTKFEGLFLSMNLSKEIPGLYHAGSVGIIMSGWLGAANYGVITSNEVERYLFTREKNEGVRSL